MTESVRDLGATRPLALKISTSPFASRPANWIEITVHVLCEEVVSVSRLRDLVADEMGWNKDKSWRAGIDFFLDPSAPNDLDPEEIRAMDSLIALNTALPVGPIDPHKLIEKGLLSKLRVLKVAPDIITAYTHGLVPGARIVAVLPEVAAGGSGVAEAAAGKTITLRTFKKGKFEPKLQEVRSQEHLEHLLQRVQAEGLVDMASEVEVDQWHKIIPGGSYVFSGGIYNALNENRFWSQQMDLQLERDAVAALLRKGDEYGPLTEYTGSIDNVLEIKDDDGKKKRQQFDGIVLNSSAVLITEVKRVADIAHVSDLEEDVVFMQKFLKQTNIPAFKGIGSNAKVIPFYTAGCIKPSEEKYFLDRGINVIRPNGLQLSVVTTPHPFIIRKTSKGIRAFHSFASAVRKILK